MNKLKIFSIIVLFCSMSFGFTTQVAAQGSKKETNAEKITRMTGELSLDKKQVASLTKIYKDQDVKLAEIKSSGADKPSQVLQRREVWKNTDTQIEGMLTPGQITKWKANRAAAHHKGGNIEPEQKND